jgi:UDPglucose 6-dehydrogenase
LRIAVIGSGHVGLTTAVCLAFCGHHATVIDVDRERIERLTGGSLPFFEAGLEELFQRASHHLHFTTDFSAASEVEACLLAVPSPTAENGGVDLSFMRTALTELGRALSLRSRPEPLLIVNKCTVPVGTVAMAAEWLNTQIEKDPGAASSSELPRARFTLSNAPEFLREGLAVRDTLYPDRLVFGVESEPDERILRDLYVPILERSFPELALGEATPSSLPGLIVTSVMTAELIKYAANTFLATKLSFINEMATLSAALGISIEDVADGIGLDHRIGRGFLTAGIGWGGSCLGKDIQALVGTAQEYGLPTPLLEAAMEVNERQRGVVARLLQEELHVLRGSRIGLLGLAFKPGTDDLRDAPSLEIARRLLALGASVSGYDPVVREVPLQGVKVQNSVAAVAAGSDALVLVTEWEEFRDLPWPDLAATMRHAVFIDGRNMMPPGQLQDAGFRYRGIGR